MHVNPEIFPRVCDPDNFIPWRFNMDWYKNYVFHN